MTERLLTSAEVCDRLRICPKTLQQLRRRRLIHALRFGHRSIRFREDAIRDFLLRREKAETFAEATL